MANYYIANAGNDITGDGSIGNPWQTIAKVNSLTLSPGDIVYFNCGDRWRETLALAVGGLESGTSGSYIKFTKYGSGDNPKIVGSNIPSGWSNISGNVWRTNNTFSSVKGLYPGSCDIYFEYSDNTKERGVYKSNTGSLVTEFDWTESAGYVYIYSTTDPSSAYESVEIPQRWVCVYTEENEYLHFDGIDLNYSSFCGMDGTSHNSVREYHGLIVENCEISCIGGVTPSQYGFGLNTVYSEYTVRNNLFYYCGRRAVSMNTQAAAGYTFTVTNVLIEDNTFKWGSHTTALDLTVNNIGTGGDTGTVYYDGIIFRRNIIEEKQNVTITYTCNQIWVQAYNNGLSGYITNVYIYSNIFKYWRNKAIAIECDTLRSIYIYNNTFFENNVTTTPGNEGYSIYADTLTGNAPNANIQVKNNIFYTTFPTEPGGKGAHIVMYNITNTKLFCDYNLYYRVSNSVRTHLINGFSYYMNTIGSLPNSWEDNCPTPGDPLFVSTSDFHLQAGSPAIGEGVYLSGVVDLDYEENYFDNPPTVGAYEYNATSAVPPTVTTTTPITDITSFTATGGGNVTDDGGGTVSVRGVCWNTSTNPTILDSHTTDGSGTGVFVSSLTGLSAGTHYYVRAYATNEIDTAYGSNVEFDILGGELGVVIINSKIHNWEIVPEGYGLLYNWYAVSDPRGLAPEGWHVPSYAEFETLVTYLGGSTFAGGKLKEVGIIHWDYTNPVFVTNQSGFTAYGAGNRFFSGNFYDLKAYGHYASSNIFESRPEEFWGLVLTSVSYSLSIGSYKFKNGISVRCIRDTDEGWVEGEQVIDIDGHIYDTVQIGTQIWLKQNLVVTHYKNGDAIPEVIDNTEWSNLTTGALCAYNNDWNNI